MSDDRTVFGKILDGDLPCHRVYEDDHVLAFLDIGPLSRGHTLVIPKQRVANVHELDDASAAALGRVLPRIARAVCKVTGVDDYNLLVNNGRPAGQDVMHVHLHIIPRTNGDGLQKEWNAGSLGSDEGARLAEHIREMLASG